MNMDCKTMRAMVNRFVAAHKADLSKIDFVVGVSRGGLVPAAFIATVIDKPLVAAYIDRQDRAYLDRTAWIKNKRLLLVDDIVRTGSTFEKISALLKRRGAKSIKSFTLFCLRSAAVRPTWTKLVAENRVMPWD